MKLRNLFTKLIKKILLRIWKLLSREFHAMWPHHTVVIFTGGHMITTVWELVIGLIIVGEKSYTNDQPMTDNLL